jgi:hypothetical protein
MVAARFDAYKQLTFSGISSTYAAVGTPWSHYMRMFRLVNTTNQNMIFSVDQVNNNFYVPANSFVVWDITAGSIPNKDGVECILNTQWYVKQDGATSPTSGSVFVEAIYAQGE